MGVTFRIKRHRVVNIIWHTCREQSPSQQSLESIAAFSRRYGVVLRLTQIVVNRSLFNAERLAYFRNSEALLFQGTSA